MAGRPAQDDVLRMIAAVFPDRNAADVLAILDRYGTEPHEQERHRVQLAVLKLCDEAEEPDLERTVADAKADFRDVLVWAESPGLGARSRTKDAARREALKARDKAQYGAWLAKGKTG